MQKSQTVFISVLRKNVREMGMVNSFKFIVRVDEMIRYALITLNSFFHFNM